MFNSFTLPPKDIDVLLTQDNVGKFWRSGKHLLTDKLLPTNNAPINELKIIGESLGLSTLIAAGDGNEELLSARLPQMFNHIQKLKIDLHTDEKIWSSMDGNELTILLGALPFIEALEISCSEIRNCRLETSSGSFDFRMKKINLPYLKSCIITTTGVNSKGEPQKVSSDIIDCLLASATQLKASDITIRWMRVDPKLKPAL